MNDELRAKIQADASAAGDIICDTFGQLIDADIPLAIIIDQLMTFAAYASVEAIGAPATAAQFRAGADKIESGYFHSQRKRN